MIPSSTGNVAEECTLGRESKQGKMLCSIARYWDGILQMKRDKLLKNVAVSGRQEVRNGKVGQLV
jgi:hypothetical protein